MQRWLRQLPNLVSSIRILLIVPMALALAHRQWAGTLWLFVIAAGSDALDGFLARRFDWRSELGGILDPIADKLMLATLFVMFAVLGYAPLWLAATVLARDGIIVFGAASYRLLLGPVAANPSFISKLNTLCQVLFILAVLCNQEFSRPAAGVILVSGALVFVTVFISGIDYVIVYGARAARAARLQRVPPRTVRSNPA